MKFQAKPLTNLIITQPFGVNWAPFYKRMGLKGHTGLDLRAPTGTPCYAVLPGTITRTSGNTKESLTKGRYVYLDTDPDAEGIVYRVVYFHLEQVEVNTGQRVNAGERLGTCDNTGEYTNGAHLHLEVRIMKNGLIINRGNGLNGAVDPLPLFPDGWVENPFKKQVYGTLLSWEGKIIKKQDDEKVYLVEAGKIRHFPDEIILWSQDRTLAQVELVSDEIIDEADEGAPMQFGKALDPQTLKEMLRLLGNNSQRALNLLEKYF